MMWVKKILTWKKAEYKVKIIFLTLPDADMAVRRVAARVKQGGHEVPEETIRRRFTKGLRNFQKIYSTLVDAWSLYDNSVNPPVLLSKEVFMPGNFAENDLDTKGIENALARAARRAATIAKETGTPLVLGRMAILSRYTLNKYHIKIHTIISRLV